IQVMLSRMRTLMSVANRRAEAQQYASLATRRLLSHIPVQLVAPGQRPGEGKVRGKKNGPTGPALTESLRLGISNQAPAGCHSYDTAGHLARPPSIQGADTNARKDNAGPHKAPRHR